MANDRRNAKRKPVENRDLIEPVLDLLNGRSVRFEHARGHRGHRLNERADRLANLEAQHQAMLLDRGLV